MYFDIAPIVAASQTVIFFSVLAIWLPIGWRFWHRKPTSLPTFSAVSWGACLLVISFWRTFSFADVYIGAELPPEWNSAVTLTIWIVCASICFMNAVTWARGGPDQEENHG